MSTTNGVSHGGDSSDLQRINDALRLSYDPHTTNNVRQSALQYLSDLKTRPEAPQHGFSLANDTNQQPFARHFGLSLLESTIRYRWDEHTQEQASTLRDWTIAMARGIRQHDPLYYRNKAASLWVEIAKREWGSSWMDMDQMLLELWETEDNANVMVNRTFVLCVLETLSEDICNREDPVAGLRQDVLGQSLNEVMIPEGLFQSHLESRANSQEVRCTRDGWFSRMCLFLSELSQAMSNDNEAVMSCAIKTLEALKPTVAWISLEAILETDCVTHLLRGIASSNEAVQTVAVEVMYSILSRQLIPHFQDQWTRIFRSVLQRSHIELIARIYVGSNTSPDDLDDAKYTLQKKISEVFSVIGDAVAQNPQLFEREDEVNAFFDALLTIFSSDSLLVSIPVLHSITKILEAKQPQLAKVLDRAVGVLLGTCSERLLRYESLPKDSTEVVVGYLHEDFETLPEQHAFLGNYRRYCTSVIEYIARSRPREALQHILGQTTAMIRDSGEVLDGSYSKNALPVLKLEAQYVVVKSALNGFTQWLSKTKRQPPGIVSDHGLEQERQDAISSLEQWCQSLMEMQAQHPDVARIATQVLAEMVNKIPHPRASFIVPVVVYLLDLQAPPQQTTTDYTDAVNALQIVRLNEAQRLAITYPNHLFDVYDDLSLRIDHTLATQNLDDRLQWGLRAFLTIILHRTLALDEQTRLVRLQESLQPISQAWQDQALTDALSSFTGFCKACGLQTLPDYLANARFSSVKEWSEMELDQEGRDLQQAIKKILAQLPLRMTSSLLGVSTEKLSEGSSVQKIASAAWGPVMKAILPNLLTLLGQATAFSRPESWSALPTELQAVMRKMLVDRFWQSGISSESRDDFTARVSGSGSTYEGFASTVRGAPRSIRDSCYHIIHSMTRFEEEFFSLTELPEPLADALFLDAHYLSTHHLQRLVSLVERLVQRCPPHYRQNFLPPLLRMCFGQLDKKIQAEWESIERARTESAEADQLSEEMKSESVVRSTTYSIVVFLSTLLDQSRHTNSISEHPSQPTLRTLVLSEPSVLEPLILFCTHALRMRDSRCCTTICRVLQSMVPTFRSDTPPSPQVREFISTEVLKAAIMSLNEPYFVDVQRDLANLIACIIHLYAPKTPTPRNVLLSLPDMVEERVDRTCARIWEAQSERQQRVLVLDLLEGVRGVSIHEAGKINGGSRGGVGIGGGSVRQKRSAMQQQFMEVEQKAEIVRGNSPALEGLQDIFGAA